MQGRVITISRQCGSGGHSIGSELAKRLDVPFYDKEIIEMTAEESGFHPQFVEEKGEHMESSMLFNLARHLSYVGREAMRSTSHYRISFILRRQGL